MFYNVLIVLLSGFALVVILHWLLSQRRLHVGWRIAGALFITGCVLALYRQPAADHGALGDLFGLIGAVLIGHAILGRIDQDRTIARIAVVVVTLVVLTIIGFVVTTERRLDLPRSFVESSRPTPGGPSYTPRSDRPVPVGDPDTPHPDCARMPPEFREACLGD